MKKEIRSLTGVRGIAALYVACYHFLEPFHANWNPLFLHFAMHGYNSVDLFFILSGFVLTLSSKKLFDGGLTAKPYSTFMKRRFARIFPIYIVLTVVYFILKFKLKGWGSFFINLTLLQILFPNADGIVGPSWSLSAEWIAYLLFPLFLFFVYRVRHKLWPVVTLVAGFGLLFFVARANSEWMNGFQPVPHINGYLDRFRMPSALLRCFAEYIIGITLYYLYAAYYPNYSKYYHYPSVPAAVLILVCLLVHNSDLALVLGFTLLVFSCSTDTGIVARFLGWQPIYFLGEVSYSLYLIHEIDDRTLKYFYKHHFTGSYLNAPVILIYLTAIIFLSYLGYRFVEVPAREYLRRKI